MGYCWNKLALWQILPRQIWVPRSGSGASTIVKSLVVARYAEWWKPVDAKSPLGMRRSHMLRRNAKAKKCKSKATYNAQVDERTCTRKANAEKCKTRQSNRKKKEDSRIATVKKRKAKCVESCSWGIAGINLRFGKSCRGKYGFRGLDLVLPPLLKA